MFSCTLLLQIPQMSAFPPVRPLDEWLQRHLASTIEEDLRFEASFYGPINSLLTHVFPLQQRFMVKPQPKLHPVAGMPPPQSEAESSERVSIDSMNNVVQSRKAGRVSTDEPDFIVVKAGFEYGGDLALAVVEVKKHEKITRVDWDQALRYLRNISHKNPASDLTVYLVTGATTYSVQLPMGEEVMVPIRYQFPTLTGLQSSLEGISKRHWAV
jgi:hypothetical protein